MKLYNCNCLCQQPTNHLQLELLFVRFTISLRVNKHAYSNKVVFADSKHSMYTEVGVPVVPDLPSKQFDLQFAYTLLLNVNRSVQTTQILLFPN